MCVPTWEACTGKIRSKCFTGVNYNKYYHWWSFYLGSFYLLLFRYVLKLTSLAFLSTTYSCHKCWPQNLVCIIYYCARDRSRGVRGGEKNAQMSWTWSLQLRNQQTIGGDRYVKWYFNIRAKQSQREDSNIWDWVSNTKQEMSLESYSQNLF